MKKLVGILIILILVLVSTSLPADSELYLKFQIKSKQELETITKIVSIDNVLELTVYAYATDEQLLRLEEAGYTYTILPHPGTLFVPHTASTKGTQVWDYYPTYDEYIDSMYQFATDYPALCQIYDVGSTVNGRSILYVKISDNVAAEEDEPEVMYTSSIHGDEITGYILMLRLTDFLLTNYGSDSLATRLVDSCEIWINPLANPDGTYWSGDHTVSGARRFNVNYVDLNRNFPDPEDGDHPDGNAWQPETVAMMDFAGEHNFVISANIHGGAEVLNYPWDTWYRRHPDDTWYIAICRQYADTAQYYSPPGYLTDLNNGITNGYDWYTVSGGRQDYMNFWHGCREITLEISGTKLLPEDSLGELWNYNKAALLDYLENALHGIRGIVSDAGNGLPLGAIVTVSNYDTDIDSSRVFTDPDVGDYHRMLPSGTYDLTFKAAGFYDKTVASIQVYDQSATRVDVQLDPLPNSPDIELISCDAPLINPGDNIAFKITLTNLGAADAIDVLATLSSEDAYVFVTQDLADYPDIIKLGGVQTSLNDFEISILTACPWNYLINFSLAVSAAGDFVDTVEFSLPIGLLVENFESGDLTRLPWEPGGDLTWTVSGISPYEGSFSAESGDIGDGGFSWLALTLNVIRTGPLSFDYRVSSELDQDFLRLNIDGETYGEWSGEIGWTNFEIELDSGSHTLSWIYNKDYMTSMGEDGAWIDRIVFPLLSSNLFIVTDSLPDWTAGYAMSESILAQNGFGILTWTDKFDDLSGTGISLSTSGLIEGIPFAAGEISFTAKVTDRAGGEDEKLLAFNINPAVEILTAILPDGGVGSAYYFQLQATGGTGDLTWLDKNGDLGGSGLSLQNDGTLSGIPVGPLSVTFTARVEDAIGSGAEHLFEFEILDLSYTCGNANGDEYINIGDVVYLSYHVFKSGPAPDPLEAGDANCDDSVNIGDAVYLLQYIFNGGLPPCCPQ